MKPIHTIKDSITRLLKKHRYHDITGNLVSGGLWVFLAQLVVQAISFCKGVFLARLLSPGDYGLFGITIVIMSALQSFSQVGIQAALIQKSTKEPAHLNVAWTLQFLRGMTLMLIMLAATPVIAALFSEPLLIQLVPVMAISFVIQGISNIGMIIFQQDVRFREVSTITTLSAIVDAAVSIFMALLFRSVWALAVGYLLSIATSTIASYILSTFRPRFFWDRTIAFELADFGKWIVSGQIIVFLVTEGDDALVASTLGLTALGYYRMAYFLSNLPATQLTNVIGQVTFPTFAKLKDDALSLRFMFQRTIFAISFVTIPLSIVLFVSMPLLIPLLIGRQWSPMIHVAQVLSAWGCLRSVGSLTGPLFIATNRPQYVTWLGSLQIVVFCIIFFPLINWFALEGAAYAVVISGATQVPVALVLASRTLGTHSSSLLLVLAPILLGAMAMIAVLYWVTLFVSTPPFLLTLISLPLGIALYAIISLSVGTLIRRRRTRLNLADV